MWRLFFPLRYFSLRNNEKRHIDFWPTAVLAALISAPYLLFPDAAYLGSGGFLDKMLPLTSALTGFFVAALVAAATFSHPDLDKTIRVGSIALVRKDADGKRIQELLTRREFACTIFGYLSFAGFVFSILAGAVIPLSAVDLSSYDLPATVAAALSPANLLYVRAFLIVAFSMTVSHMMVVTSLGIYYLMDRLYKTDAKVTAQKKDFAA